MRGLQLVDFGGKDEVIFGQAADGMGPDFNPHVAISFEVQIRMMRFFLCQGRHPLKKSESIEEISGSPLFSDPFSIVRQGPARELGKLALGLVDRAGLDPSFARKTFLGREFGGTWQSQSRNTPLLGKTEGVGNDAWKLYILNIYDVNSKGRRKTADFSAA
jgi:hypothetical protein